MNPRLGAVLWMVVALLAACERAASEAAPSALPPPVASAPVRAAPADMLPRIDAAGLQARIQAAAASNRVVVLDFWATWCQPCVEMFPALHAGVESLGAGVELITVSLDDEGDLEQAAIAFLDKHHARDNAFLLQPDQDARLATPRTLGKEWQDLVVPAVLVFDRRGQLAGEYLQGGSADQVVENVKALLAAPEVQRQ